MTHLRSGPVDRELRRARVPWLAEWLLARALRNVHERDMVLGDLQEEFGRAFHDASRLYLLPVYAAGESPIPGIDSELIARSARGAGHQAVVTVSGPVEAVERLAAEARPGDVILTLGAGDVTKLGEPILVRLGEGV